MRREFIISNHNFLIDPKRIIIIERWVSGKHLEDENSEGPPVYKFIMPFRLDDFRGKVLWCTT
jgi:hypothetical protein